MGQEHSKATSAHGRSIGLSSGQGAQYVRSYQPEREICDFFFWWQLKEQVVGNLYADSKPAKTSLRNHSTTLYNESIKL